MRAKFRTRFLERVAHGAGRRCDIVVDQHIDFALRETAAATDRRPYARAILRIEFRDAGLLFDDFGQVADDERQRRRYALAGRDPPPANAGRGVGGKFELRAVVARVIFGPLRVGLRNDRPFKPNPFATFDELRRGNVGKSSA